MAQGTKSLQIIPVGWEYDRLLYGIKQRPPNKVIFLCSKQATDPDKKWGMASMELAEKMGESVKSLIDYEIVLLDYHSIDDCLEEVTAILERASKEYGEISANISSGTTILKMSMMLAAQYYPMKLFYVIPAQYTHPGEIISVGARGMVDLPAINLSQISLPKKKLAEIFLLIEKNKKSFTAITKEYARSANIKVTADSLKSLKSWVFYYFKKLEQQGLISTETEGRQLYVSLTQTGKFIRVVMQHKKLDSPGQTKLKVKKKSMV